MLFNTWNVCKKINRSHTHTHRQRTTPPTPTHTHTRQEEHPNPPNKHLPQTLNNARRWRDDDACHLPRMYAEHEGGWDEPWPLQDIRSLRGFCARINQPCVAPPTCIAHRIAILAARPLRNIRPPSDLPFVCFTPYDIGNGNIV